MLPSWFPAHPVTKPLQAAPGSQSSSKSNRRGMLTAPPLPSVRNPTSQCARASSHFTARTPSLHRATPRAGYRHCPHSTHGEAKASREATCARFPKTKISLEAEQDSASQTLKQSGPVLDHCTMPPGVQGSHQGPSPGNMSPPLNRPGCLPTMQMACSPEKGAFFSRGQVSWHAHPRPQLPAGCSISCWARAAPSTRIKEH